MSRASPASCATPCAEDRPWRGAGRRPRRRPMACDSGAESRRIGGVRVRPFAEGGGVVWIAEPEGPAPALTSWWSAHRHELDSLLRRVGGVLFRGFDLPGDAFADLVAEVLIPAAYVYRST